jgi:hypothetical protein
MVTYPVPIVIQGTRQVSVWPTEVFQIDLMIALPEIVVVIGTVNMVGRTSERAPGRTPEIPTAIGEYLYKLAAAVSVLSPRVMIIVRIAGFRERVGGTCQRL